MEVSIGEESVSPGSLLKAGSDVAVVKRQVFQGQSSAIGAGVWLRGKLASDIRVGSEVVLGIGNTSPVSRIDVSASDGSITFDTATSKYELLDKRFKGLSLNSDLGSVHLPVDSQPAKLSNEVVDIPVGNSGDRIYINKPALKEILLETHGAHLFRAVDYRFMVLAKVGNIHLPYYVSSEGTSGKNAGEWYPFFGYTGGWIVKGSHVKDGQMNYHPKIDAVRDALNRNLLLPRYISPAGKLGTGPMTMQEPSNVLFDLNNYLDYQPVNYGADSQKEEEFVREMTGYAPERMNPRSGTALPWIESIVSAIK